MHTEPRSPRVLKWRITGRRPVIVDVMSLLMELLLSGLRLVLARLRYLRYGITCIGVSQWTAGHSRLPR